MVRTVVWCVAGLAWVLVGCTAAEGDDGATAQPDEETADLERGPGKADSAGSCSTSGKSYCGKRAPGGCWCDSACAQYGDCCADKSVVCDGQVSPCEPDPSVKIADVYFDINASVTGPWRSCYTVSTQEAVRQIQAGEVPGDGQHLKFLRTQGSRIFASHYQLSGQELVFDPCVFGKNDACTLDCTVVVYDHPSESTATTIDEALEARIQQKNPAYRAADCSKGVAYTLTLTDKLKLSRADYKVAQTALQAGKGIHKTGAIGTVSIGNSLDPNLDWSGGLAFFFMESRWFPELCDASIAMVSRDPQGWIDQLPTWCPWGVGIAKISCKGMPTLTDPAFQPSIPLATDAADIKSYCE